MAGMRSAAEQAVYVAELKTRHHWISGTPAS